MMKENLEKLKKLSEEFLMDTYARGEIGFAYGLGAKLYSVDEEEYIDFGSGIGVSSLGYGHQGLAQAIALQASKLIHTSNLYYIEPQARLAQKLVELSGYEEMKVFFANSGAEANEGAIKLARKYGEVAFEKKRYKIITLQSSFHGRTLATLKATGQSKFHQYFSPFPEGFVIAKDLGDVYHKIDEETCAVMIELIQGEGGIYALSKQEVQDLASELAKKGVLLIVDEVQSGIYRSGEMLASHLYEIVPDIITLAKGLGGGVPIGAVMSQKEIFTKGDHGSTFGGNFLSTQAGVFVLETLSEMKQNGEIDKTIQVFHQELEGLLVEFKELFCQKVGVGLMVGLEARSEEIQSKVLEVAKQERVLILRSGRNVVRFLPPILIAKEEILEGFARLRKGLSSLIG